jgi:hypothetical protein
MLSRLSFPANMGIFRKSHDHIVWSSYEIKKESQIKFQTHNIRNYRVVKPDSFLSGKMDRVVLKFCKHKYDCS